jgi:hypothetical protein
MADEYDEDYYDDEEYYDDPDAYYDPELEDEWDDEDEEYYEPSEGYDPRVDSLIDALVEREAAFGLLNSASSVLSSRMRAKTTSWVSALTRPSSSAACSSPGLEM